MSRASTLRRRPIVVGIEHSERSRDAMAFARTLGRTLGSPLILAAVYPVDPAPAAGALRAYARTLEAEAEAGLEWAAAPLAGVEYELRTVACTSVARGLQDTAEAEDALAIVVGPSHRGALGRIVPGSVGERLLHGAPCPVAVAPSGYWGNVRPRIDTIGVGYISVPDAQAALQSAFALAAESGASLKIVSVLEPPAVAASIPVGWGYGEVDGVRRETIDRDIARAVESAGGGVETTVNVIDGYADDELAVLSGEVDLLVCGSRGYGPLNSVLLGSVSTGVLRKARCPVLVVPRGSRLELDRPAATAAAAG
jgi:nucleotide-binding universal stress UspA family protein